MKRDRGMKKWLPYKSLDEQGDFMARMEYEMNKIEKPSISYDEEKEINDALVNYHDQVVEIRYFDDGYIHKECGVIDKINIFYKNIYINDIYIDFSQIVSIV
ncbi:MAG: YolD-like family protein [Bacilli bacterium]|nr:YolD-like family protein [Bacilli bacterium]